MDRRQLLSFGAVAALLPAVTSAAAQDSGKPLASDPSVTMKPLLPPLESFPIWPKGKMPGAAGVTAKEEWILRNPKDGNPNDTAATHVTDPILMVRRAAKPNGAAILMIPGGGYVRVAVSRAGGGTDKELADAGTTVFIMTYRLPHDNWGSAQLAPLQDAQRAIRLIRHNAAKYGIDPNRIAVMGFSAGGHLAGWLSESFGRETYAPIDAADTQSARPLVTGMFYPVMTMLAPYAHGGSVKSMFPNGATDEEKKKVSLEFSLPKDMPPTFLAHAGDDKTVPAENSLILYQALRAQKTPTELHIFELGGHGLSGQDYTTPWMAFAKRHGLWG
ncbi:alpha/beta hydrolase [Asticcacaulis sp. BYS171W]|uniref:Alpha/beta hydrolase n=1 Tax=Asticcacaulis aquaticus TaxID=2984212 RepID=A0ABT5HXM6_9CAUL|nr:alpha/beta hydrolase [Asticcacaulis aquaticus]MDC7684826.1 alpha/beta hydrolase [Asticcacaulis aquaticus]